jgi:hypothetical protein
MIKMTWQNKEQQSSIKQTSSTNNLMLLKDGQTFCRLLLALAAGPAAQTTIALSTAEGLST